MTTVVFENHNVNPVTGGVIFYRYEKDADIVGVSFDNKKSWAAVPLSTTIRTESDFTRWVYGFKSGLAFVTDCLARNCLDRK